MTQMPDDDYENDGEVVNCYTTKGVPGGDREGPGRHHDLLTRGGSVQGARR